MFCLFSPKINFQNTKGKKANSNWLNKNELELKKKDKNDFLMKIVLLLPPKIKLLLLINKKYNHDQSGNCNRHFEQNRN